MHRITAFLLVGLFLSLPVPALAKSVPMTDAQLDDTAAAPDDPEPTGQAGLEGADTHSIPSVSAQRALQAQYSEGTQPDSIASVSAQHALQRQYSVIFVTPYWAHAGAIEIVTGYHGAE